MRHSLREHDGYSVENVALETLPGFFCTGNLYRPVGRKTLDAIVLCPHGHFRPLGRYRDSQQIRCAQLARMGCVTFIFDMLGYVDSHQVSYELAHRYAKRRPEFETNTGWGFYSPQAESRLHSILGLQTWNGVRALDFLASLISERCLPALESIP